MFNKKVAAMALGAVALSASPAQAADDARSSIHITANIPTQQFHVQPRDPEFGKDEVMYWDPVKSQLTPVRQTFDVKNTDGSVHAYLPAGQPALTNGSSAIPLLVRFNNVTLTSTPQEVVDDPTSTPGTQAEMVIYASTIPLPDQTGLFNADFTVIFDAVPRVIR
ncbi:CS1 type fimbrial major subunit [Pseudomonas corrugata]|uniref:CS1 type fimbrial major subunit n=1 Tax=Pseudomonas corrugata TaxID=47879 RepID=A0A3M3ET47_9PSED|nr:CS1 type fimbrial major subunit [Pseudomonas corrugata]AOE62006.1 adhesin [Pseudomonas corrugata]MDU9023214.1 CS1 type fimbrial major subunit [Pseudomonas corrugata]MDU9033748.1 CS1 type fimbrial major subunit [Pseudomonas corrugata]MDU9038328.1 CS1 type fimbrial major subunit [Pseudomonas corrugata]QTH13233.1 adhesin [Pseudomonas corrugata]